MNHYVQYYTTHLAFARKASSFNVFYGSSLGRIKKEQKKKQAVEKAAKSNVSYAIRSNGRESALVAVRANKTAESAPNGIKLRVNSRRTCSKIQNNFHAFYRATSSSCHVLLTLTFINRVDDVTGVHCLNKFLTVLRRKASKQVNYIWVAERQNDNKEHPGNIHFHIMLDHYVPIKQFNALWVMQQYNAGITHPSYTDVVIASHYAAGTMQTILNPVDVKKINSIDGLSMYLTQYVTKNKDAFACSPWHCSRFVSRLITGTAISMRQFEESADITKNSIVNKQTGELYEAKTFVSEYCIMRTIYNKKYFLKNMNLLEDLNKWIINGMVQAERPLEETSLPDMKLSMRDYKLLFTYN
ncbi:MAG: hypothetical protein JWN76_1238 [Chitinophagaceae bacterium]|nr:hypothetical protein [Chitinophagaceae bacterium]